MDFPRFKHISLVLINFVIFLKELTGDYRVTTNHLSMQFKMLFKDRLCLKVSFGLIGLVTF
jgi:hypothetical protein